MGVLGAQEEVTFLHAGSERRKKDIGFTGWKNITKEDRNSEKEFLQIGGNLRYWYL